MTLVKLVFYRQGGSAKSIGILNSQRRFLHSFCYMVILDLKYPYFLSYQPFNLT